MPRKKKEEKLIILPHFKPEEVEALEREHERRVQILKGRGSFDLDDERVRDAIQREDYWRAQLNHLEERGLEKTEDYKHAEEELAHALFTQGKIDDALVLARSPERRAHYLNTHDAIRKDDLEECECEEQGHVVGKYPSAKHGGRMMEIRQCPKCTVVNIG